MVLAPITANGTTKIRAKNKKQPMLNLYWVNLNPIEDYCLNLRQAMVQKQRKILRDFWSVYKTENTTGKRLVKFR